MRSAALTLSASILAFFGCSTPGESPMMKPGENCLACHDRGGLHWYTAGTVFLDSQAPVGEGVQGAEVVITDSNQRRISLTTNGAGNFYTAETLVFPANVEVRRGGKTIQMPVPVPQGGCNHCHTVPPNEAAPGRIYAP